MTDLKTLSDNAIHTYEHFKSSGEEPSSEFLDKYPHWDDIFQKITEVWQNKYESHIQIVNDHISAMGLVNKFRSDCNKIFSKKSDYTNLKRYYTYIVDIQVNYISQQLLEMLPDAQKENKERERRKSARSLKINLEKFETKKTNNVVEVCKKMDIAADLSQKMQPEVVHMMRCHSKQNDPNDNTTEVTDVCFELSDMPGALGDAPKFTDTFATCGQNMINFIDARNGKILKRFNDDHMNQKGHKEVYCKLAWTIIHEKSVLVAGGKHGQIKVIMPHKNVCISRFDAHVGQIQFLLFHHKYSDMLLTASDDCVNIWRINIKDSAETIECECSYELIKKVQYRMDLEKKEKVLSMCFVPNDYLVIATEFGNYSVSLSDDALFNSVESMETNYDDINSYLTSAPEKPKNFLTADKLEESFLANNLFYVKNVLMATLVDSTSIHKLDVSTEDKLRLQISGTIDLKKHPDYKNSLTTQLTLTTLNNKDCLLQPSQGQLYNIGFDDNLTKFKYIMKLQLPTNYTIKNKKDNYNIPVDDYNLCDKPIVLKNASNGEFIVSITNQNIIVIWKNN